MIKTVLVNNPDDYFDEIKEFCRVTSETTDNKSLKKNMDYVTWKTNTNSLLNRTFVKRKFHDNEGALVLAYNNDRLIALSGVDRFRYDPDNVALMGTRYFLLKKPKGVTNFFHDYIFPEQVAWCIDNHIKVGIIRFNEYNYTLHTIFCRILEKKGTILGRKNPNLYQEIKLVPHPDELLIEFVKQKAVFCYFDKNFNWELPKEIILET